MGHDNIIMCYKCGKTGHKAFQCASKGNRHGTKRSCSSKKPRFQGKCNLCGGQGHKAEKCFANPKDKDKVPEWYLKKKLKKEQKESALSSNNNDMVPMAYETGQMNSTELLDNLEIWVADTGASVDSTQYF